MKKKPGPKVEDINTMHRYRDAIVVKDGNISEKLMFGAYVLFPYPNDEEEYRSHQFCKSIDTVNIGGLPFMPGKTKIAEELLTKLVGESDASAYDKAILPRGIEEKLEKVDWTREDVLVGSLGSREQWKECFNKNTTMFRLEVWMKIIIRSIILRFIIQKNYSEKMQELVTMVR